MEGLLWQKEGGVRGREVGPLRGTSSATKTGFVPSPDSEQGAFLCFRSLQDAV